MSITRFGSKELEKALKKWSKDIEKEVKRIVDETAIVIQNEARARAPVDSGYLRQSITYVMDIDSLGYTATITVGATYAPYIEWGTGKYSMHGNGRRGTWVYFDEKLGRFVVTAGQPPQPFWFDSILVGRKHFLAEMKRLGA